MLAILALAAAMHATVVASDRSEVRVRDSDEPTGRAIDLETSPGLALHADERLWEIDAAYAPRFTVRALNNDSEGTDILQRGTLGVAWIEKKVRITAREDLLWGRQSFASLAVASPTTGLPRLDTLPLPTTIQYLSTRTIFAARVTASRRWTVTSAFEYQRFGGTDDASRLVLPLQSGPRLEESAEFLGTRIDRWTTTLAASRLVFSSGPESTLFEATEAWRHEIDRDTVSTIRAGLAQSFARDTGGGAIRRTAWPIVEATLSHELPERVTLLGVVRVAPIVDRLSGMIDERAQISAAMRWIFAPRWLLRGETGVAQSVPTNENAALTLWIGEAAVGWSPARSIVLELGTRSAWQHLRGVDALPPQWVAFLAATFTSDALEL